jgi:signal transduction histidine kinase
MLNRLGLRSRMAVSYVIITAVTLLVAEAILLAIVSPWISSAKESIKYAQVSEIQSRAKAIVAEDATTLRLAAESLQADGAKQQNDREVLAAAAQRGFPRLALASGAPEGSAEVIATVEGKAVRGSALSLFPAGSSLPPITTGSAARSGTSGSGAKTVAWASSPVVIVDSARAGALLRQIGILYVQFPSPSGPTNRVPNSVSDPGSLLLPGALMLVLLAPVGALFGLLSTNMLIRRIRRLGGVTQAVADGDLSARVPQPSGDEVGRLEDGFNRMAERLEAASQAERAAAGAEAQQTERKRIATELHDSVSQNLYSMNLIAAGLRRALPEGSELQHQARSLEQTVTLTMREMQALLLELRSVALDGGLAPAIKELGLAFEARLGIRVHTDVTAVDLPPSTEHVLLRIAQEALSNAARHGEPRSIEVSLAEADGGVVLVVRDDGRGFEPAEAEKRYGMGLRMMRERVAELDGDLEVDGVPDRGTLVRVRLPGGAQ